MTTKTDSELVGASAPTDSGTRRTGGGCRPARVGDPERSAAGRRRSSRAARPGADRNPAKVASAHRRGRPARGGALRLARSRRRGSAQRPRRGPGAGVGAGRGTRTDAVRLAGYDYRHLGRDFGVVIANSTPSFRRNFTQSSNALRSALTKYHATANARVVSSGLASSSTSRAVALVFLDQRVTNSTRPSATTDRSQIEITLVRSGDHWLIDQVVLL